MFTDRQQVPIIEDPYSLKDDVLNSFMTTGFCYLKIPEELSEEISKAMTKTEKVALEFYRKPIEVKRKNCKQFTLENSEGYEDIRSDETHPFMFERSVFNPKKLLPHMESARSELLLMEGVFREKMVAPLLKSVTKRDLSIKLCLRRKFF